MRIDHPNFPYHSQAKVSVQDSQVREHVLDLLSGFYSNARENYYFVVDRDFFDSCLYDLMAIHWKRKT